MRLFYIFIYFTVRRSFVRVEILLISNKCLVVCDIFRDI